MRLSSKGIAKVVSTTVAASVIAAVLSISFFTFFLPERFFVQIFRSSLFRAFPPAAFFSYTALSCRFFRTQKLADGLRYALFTHLFYQTSA